MDCWEPCSQGLSGTPLSCIAHSFVHHSVVVSGTTPHDFLTKSADMQKSCLALLGVTAWLPPSEGSIEPLHSFALVGWTGLRTLPPLFPAPFTHPSPLSMPMFATADDDVAEWRSAWT